MSQEQRTIRWYDRMAVALALACAAGVVWSAHEATAFRYVGVGFWPMWYATGVAAAIVATIATAVAAVSAAILLHRKVGPAILARLSPGRLLQGLLFLLLMSFGVLFALFVFQTVFASSEVHRLALALTVPPLALAAAGLTGVLLPPSGRLSRLVQNRFAGPRMMGVFTVVVLFAWLVCLGAMVPDVVINLSPRDLVPIVATFVVAWLGALFLKPGRWVYLVGLPCAFLLVLLSVLFAVYGYQNETRIAVSRSTHGAKLVHWQWTRIGANKAPLGKRNGSCFNHVGPVQTEHMTAVRPGAPDIVVLLVDGLQWNHTSMGGYKRDTTPNLHRLGSKAAVFRAYSPSTCTRQSMRAFFTGVFPSQVEAPKEGKWGVTLAEGQETMASLLQAAGYEILN